MKLKIKTSHGSQEVNVIDKLFCIKGLPECSFFKWESVNTVEGAITEYKTGRSMGVYSIRDLVNRINEVGFDKFNERVKKAVKENGEINK